LSAEKSLRSRLFDVIAWFWGKLPEANSNWKRSEIGKMKKLYMSLALAVAFATGAVVSAQVRDWHDLDKVHQHVIEAIHEMDRAREANHYDMDGHGAKAEQHLHDAEHELDLAVRAAQRN